MTTPPEKLWFTTAEVAQMFGVHPDTVRRWHREFPWFKPSGRNGRGYCWDRETIERRRTFKAINIYE